MASGTGSLATDAPSSIVSTAAVSTTGLSIASTIVTSSIQQPCMAADLVQSASSIEQPKMAEGQPVILRPNSTAISNGQRLQSLPGGTLYRVRPVNLSQLAVSGTRSVSSADVKNVEQWTGPRPLFVRQALSTGGSTPLHDSAPRLVPLVQGPNSVQNAVESVSAQRCRLLISAGNVLPVKDLGGSASDVSRFITPQNLRLVPVSSITPSAPDVLPTDNTMRLVSSAPQTPNVTSSSAIASASATAAALSGGNLIPVASLLESRAVAAAAAVARASSGPYIPTSTVLPQSVPIKSGTTNEDQASLIQSLLQSAQPVAISEVAGQLAAVQQQTQSSSAPIVKGPSALTSPHLSPVSPGNAAVLIPSNQLTMPSPQIVVGKAQKEQNLSQMLGALRYTPPTVATLSASVSNSPHTSVNIFGSQPRLPTAHHRLTRPGPARPIKFVVDELTPAANLPKVIATKSLSTDWHASRFIYSIAGQDRDVALVHLDHTYSHPTTLEPKYRYLAKVMHHSGRESHHLRVLPTRHLFLDRRLLKRKDPPLVASSTDSANKTKCGRTSTDKDVGDADIDVVDCGTDSGEADALKMGSVFDGSRLNRPAPLTVVGVRKSKKWAKVLARIRMLGARCERHINLIRLGAQTSGDNEDWDELIDKTKWTPLEHRLFNKFTSILSGDRLWRLAKTSPAGSEVAPIKLTSAAHSDELCQMITPIIQRRIGIDRTARRLRTLFASVAWNSQRLGWLHNLVHDFMPSAYLVGYIEALQALRHCSPAVKCLVDDIIVPSRRIAETPTEIATMADVTTSSGQTDTNMECGGVPIGLENSLNVRQKTEISTRATRLLLQSKWTPDQTQMLNIDNIARLPDNPVIIVPLLEPPVCMSHAMSNGMSPNWRKMLTKLSPNVIFVCNTFQSAVDYKRSFAPWPFVSRDLNAQAVRFVKSGDAHVRHGLNNRMSQVTSTARKQRHDISQRRISKVSTYLHSLVHAVFVRVRTEARKARDVEAKRAKPNGPRRPIILIGWGVSAAINLLISKMEPLLVSAVICLGPSTSRPFSIDRPLAPHLPLMPGQSSVRDFDLPVALFVVGDLAGDRGATVEDVEETRRSGIGSSFSASGLVVVGGVNERLRMRRSHRLKMGLTSGMIDRCILDEVVGFLHDTIYHRENEIQMAIANHDLGGPLRNVSRAPAINDPMRCRAGQGNLSRPVGSLPAVNRRIVVQSQNKSRINKSSQLAPPPKMGTTSDSNQKMAHASSSPRRRLGRPINRRTPKSVPPTTKIGSSSQIALPSMKWTPPVLPSAKPLPQAVASLAKESGPIPTSEAADVPDSNVTEAALTLASMSRS